jgi:diphthamide synthase (EF-2-diphthine--ammonia ligase)
VVLLANLFPAQEGVEELDSHMYQTVGHSVVAAYADCCGLPLLRRRIRGASLQVRAAQLRSAHAQRVGSPVCVCCMLHALRR